MSILNLLQTLVSNCKYRLDLHNLTRGILNAPKKTPKLKKPWTADMKFVLSLFSRVPTKAFITTSIKPEKIPVKNKLIPNMVKLKASKGKLKTKAYMWIPKKIAFPTPNFLVIIGTEGMDTKIPNAKQKRATLI